MGIQVHAVSRDCWPVGNLVMKKLLLPFLVITGLAQAVPTMTIKPIQSRSRRPGTTCSGTSCRPRGLAYPAMALLEDEAGNAGAAKARLAELLAGNSEFSEKQPAMALAPKLS